jgi:hypothetical protein
MADDAIRHRCQRGLQYECRRRKLNRKGQDGTVESERREAGALHRKR